MGRCLHSARVMIENSNLREGLVMGTTQLRIICSRSGWWLLRGGRAVLLPPDGVRPAEPGEVPSVGLDHERSRCVTAVAVDALSPSRFFETDPPESIYSITVLTATQCNLGCDYCFQNLTMAPEGSHAPPRSPTLFWANHRLSRSPRLLPVNNVCFRCLG